MPRYVTTETCYVNDTIYRPGDTIECDVSKKASYMVPEAEWDAEAGKLREKPKTK